MIRLTNYYSKIDSDDHVEQQLSFLINMSIENEKYRKLSIPLFSFFIAYKIEQNAKKSFLPVHWWQFCLHVHTTVSRKEPNIKFSYRKKDLMLGRLKGCSNGRVTLFIVPDIIFLRKSQQWVVKTEGSGFESFYNTCFCYKIFGKVFALFCS